jgi:Family of unknown function (DUF5677)
MENLEQRLQALCLRMEPLERFVHAVAGTLSEPILYHSGKQHLGFRYTKPDVRHFCLLKAVRAVSAFNAAIELARSGYTQEVATTIRVVIECTTHIEFVISQGARKEAENYVDAYFADYMRNEAGDFRKAQVRQGLVHETIGADLDNAAQQSDRADQYKDVDAGKLFSGVYCTLSNYVHAKYPETMDLYGGIPARFHLRGMCNTPKDRENIEILETFFTTVSQTLKLMALNLKLRALIEGDPTLLRWYHSQ